MFDFARRMQLAAGDSIRRVALKAAAAGIGLVGLGFLLAALWSFLAETLDWGPVLASLTIGAGLAAIAGILFAMSLQRRHEMPTTEDLKREVQARAAMATDAAVERARTEAARVVDMAGDRAQALVEEASYRAGKLANDAERKVFGILRPSGLGSGAEPPAPPAGQGRGQAPSSKAGGAGALLAAFAVGVTLAAKLRERRQRHEGRRNS